MPARRRPRPKLVRAGAHGKYAVALASSHPDPAGSVILPPLELRPPAELPQALVSEYLQSCHNDLVQLRAALAAGEYETARRLGHQMKATGRPYGFPGLTQIGRAIEWAASQRASPELDSRIQWLEVCLNSIELASERG